MTFSGIIELKRTEREKVGQVWERSETPISQCFHCRACACGCPFIKGMDLPPHGVLRLLQYGLLQQALACQTIWVCVGCHTCSSQCPMGIDLAAVMNTLRRLALERGLTPGKPNILAFHREVRRSLQDYGRVHKLGVMWRYKMHQQGWLQDLDVGLKMLAKRKLEFWPTRVRALAELRFLFPDEELV